MKVIKLEMFIEVDDDAVEEIKKVEHHVDYLLDFENYPEIKSVFGVKIKSIEN